MTKAAVVGLGTMGPGIAATLARAGMSVRSFQRKFSARIGETPARFLDMLRLEKARRLLESGRPVKTVPGAVGFLTEAGFRRAFQKRYGVSPTHHAAMSGS